MIALRVEVKAVEALADSLGSIDAETLGRASLEGVNKVAQETYTESRVRMIRTINLTDAYLTQRMFVTLGTDVVRPIATITAPGDFTNLVSYQPRQLTQPNKPFRLVDGRKPPKRIGFAARGIPVGFKQAGVAVSVTKGTSKPISYAFIITNKKGFTFVAHRKKTDRTGKGKIIANLAPSVYQLFRVVLSKDYLASIQTDLSAAIASLSVASILKALK